MPISEYVRNLRSRVGSSLLLVPSVTGLVFDDRGRVLLARHSNGGGGHRGRFLLLIRAAKAQSLRLGRGRASAPRPRERTHLDPPVTWRPPSRQVGDR